PGLPLECGEVYSGSPGYFRPEYVELVQRLDPETMQWLTRTYPVLGWRTMDPRPFVPKPVPGDGAAGGFRYDTGRRNMEMEALFHFGPVPGNGTLISELIELDEHRLLTVNRASRNLSLLDLEEPDLKAVIQVPLGLQALEYNLAAGELYLVEHGSTAGMLIYSLKSYQPADTMMLDFHPGAILLSRDTRFLYMTDEKAGFLVCWDLANGETAVRVSTDLRPPYLLAVESRSGTLVLVSRSSGEIRLFQPGSLEPLGVELALDGPLLDYCAPPESGRLFLASGTCQSSSVFSLSLEQGGSQAGLEHLLGLSTAVKELGADPGGRYVYLIDSGERLFRVDADRPREVSQVDLHTPLQRVLVSRGRVYVTGGLTDLFVLKQDLSGDFRRVSLEAGPGPMVERSGRLIVANGLASSVTILDSDRLEEEVSLLVGVLLGRVFYQDRRLVVNNCFRENIMVFDPDNLLIEDIIPLGGSLDYLPEMRSYLVFDDSLVAVLASPPSRVAMRLELEMPRGIKLYAPTGDQKKILVADQALYLFQLDLERNFRFGDQLLPGACTGLFSDDKQVWAFFQDELYRYTLGGGGLMSSRGYSVRPYKMSRRYLASDGFRRYRGSELFWVSDERLVELPPTQGEVRVMRHDPDTTYTYVGTDNNLYVFERGYTRQRSVVSLDEGVEDIYLPAKSAQAYIAGRDRITIVNRETLFRWDDIDRGGSFIYAGGDDLFLRDSRNPRRLVVADGYRGRVFQEIDLPLTPTDAVADQERLFLLGAAEGAVAVYVNRVDTSRLPRSPDRQAWDTDADRRAGTHR
ncbi:MAG: hypothetical protein JXQ83_04840, partial [Candidatus Glassbacteria bacterium]|nr:hypothetical protein [Candidatus Glassbacteria bacterium]